MAPTRRPSDGLLARVNFPLYAVEMLTSRHVLVAGGGGASKTGVANGFVSRTTRKYLFRRHLNNFHFIFHFSGNIRNLPQWSTFLCPRSSQT